jgi:flagellar biosynthetic protein FliO
MATLFVALVVGGGLAALAARSADSGAVPATTSEAPRSFLDDSDLGQESSLGLDNGQLFLKMMGSVVLVIVLAVAALYLSKKVLPKVTHAAGKEIRVVETTYLGPRKALHLVEVGNQKLLIGSTNERIATLAHVGEAWLDLSKQDMDQVVSS